LHDDWALIMSEAGKRGLRIAEGANLLDLRAGLATLPGS
jgi:hypothetical protein